MIPFNRNCREIAALLVAREDRRLGISDRFALRLHMLICDSCPRFEGQLLGMRNRLEQWRHYAPTDETSQDAPLQK